MWVGGPKTASAEPRAEEEASPCGLGCAEGASKSTKEPERRGRKRETERVRDRREADRDRQTGNKAQGKDKIRSPHGPRQLQTPAPSRLTLFPPPGK